MNKLNFFLWCSRFVKIDLAMIPPNENPIMFIVWMYGFFYKNFYIYSAPFFPKDIISLFSALLRV